MVLWCFISEMAASQPRPNVLCTVSSRSTRVRSCQLYKRTRFGSRSAGFCHRGGVVLGEEGVGPPGGSYTVRRAVPYICFPSAMSVEDTSSSAEPLAPQFRGRVPKLNIVAQALASDIGSG